MAEAVMQLVAKMGCTSLLPQDAVENVVAIQLPAGTWSPTDRDTAMAAFRDFYNTLHGAQTLDIADRLNVSVDRSTNKAQILAYYSNDLTGGTPMGSPIGTLNWTVDPRHVGGTDLPEEAACVISYHADLTDVPVTEPNPTPPPAVIRPAQRRRGRMYIGPLNSFAGATGAGSFFRPVAAFRSDLGLAFAGFAQAINAIADFTLCVWSKADAALYPVTAGWVDDAWDTQRRRGVAPTLRTAFTV